MADRRRGRPRVARAKDDGTGEFGPDSHEQRENYQRTTRSSRNERDASPILEQFAEIPRRGTRRPRNKRSLESVHEVGTKSSDDTPQSSISSVSRQEQDQNPTSALRESPDAQESSEVVAVRVQALLETLQTYVKYSTAMYDQLQMMNSNPTSTDLTKLIIRGESFYDIHKRLATGPFIDYHEAPISMLRQPGQPEYFPEAQSVSFMGNLVHVLVSIVRVKVGNRDASGFWAALDGASSILFDPTFTRTGGVREAGGLLFQIRCSHLVSMIENSTASPVLLAATAFWGGSYKKKRDAQVALESGSATGSAFVLEGQAHEDYAERVRSLAQTLPTQQNAAMAHLQSICPTEDLLAGLRHWATTAFENLKQTSPGLGSFLSQPPPDRESPTINGASESLFVSQEDHAVRGAMEEVKNDEPYASEDSDDSESEAEDAEVFIPKTGPDVILHPQMNHRPPPLPSRSNALHSETAPRQIGIGSVNSRPQSNQEQRESPQHKRRRDPEGSDGSDGFEPNKKASGLPRRPASSAIDLTLGDDDEHAHDAHAEPFSTQIQRRALATRRLYRGSALMQEQPGSSTVFLASRAPQTRTRWPSEDDKQLIELIARHHASWTEVEKNASFVVPRGQVACRDRARNLKVQLLQGDCLLPPGFDEVVLGAKERHAVIKCNRNPYRSVRDVDARGAPINTEISEEMMR